MRSKKEIEQDISDLKDAIAVTDDKEEKTMLEEGLAEYEKELADADKEPEVEKVKKAKKKAEPKEQPKPEPRHSDGEFEVREVDGATLVALKEHPKMVVTIEEKSGKWHSTCCSEEKKHPVQETKAEAIKAAKKFLSCEVFLLKYKVAAKKTIEAKKKYNAKHGETNVPMTVKKTVDTVENKVEKIVESGKAITKPQITELEKSVRKIVATIRVAIKTKEDKKKFVLHLIAELKKML